MQQIVAFLNIQSKIPYGYPKPYGIFMKNTQSELLHSNIKNPALSLSVQDCFFERFHGSIFEENNKGGGILDAIFDVHFHFRGKMS